VVAASNCLGREGEIALATAAELVYKYAVPSFSNGEAV
jgi:hypothetical protein